jgi:hypothetical protein
MPHDAQVATAASPDVVGGRTKHPVRAVRLPGLGPPTFAVVALRQLQEGNGLVACARSNVACTHACLRHVAVEHEEFALRLRDAASHGRCLQGTGWGGGEGRGHTTSRMCVGGVHAKAHKPGQARPACGDAASGLPAGWGTDALPPPPKIPATHTAATAWLRGAVCATRPGYHAGCMIATPPAEGATHPQPV